MINNNKDFLTPILLIAWRRPETIKKVINSMRIVKPRKIYIACDGPNDNPVEKRDVQETRLTIEKSIDWECEKHKLYSKKNNGCQMGVSNALYWFFENEPEGIILEDDCVPNKEFFYYCSELLEKYRSDNRIWCISGSNFQKGIRRGEASYYFSRYNHCWGWASWRNRWEHYDAKMEEWEKLRNTDFLKSIFRNYHQVLYWKKIFDNLIYKNYPDSWAYRWTYTCFKNNGLTILPNRNLVDNIGFGDKATHTKKGKSPSTQNNLAFKSNNIYPLIHPKNVYLSIDADNFTENNHFSHKLISINAMKFYIKLFLSSFNIKNNT